MDPAEQVLQDAPEVEPGSTQEQFDWDSDANPYKKRFEDYRREEDRRTTKLSTYEQQLEDLRSSDLARQRAAAQALGIELVDDEPSYVDPYTELRAEIDSVKSALTQSEQARETERKAMLVEQRINSLSDLDESDKDWVLARAVALPPVEGGLPDIQSAYSQLKARDEARMEAWAKTKQSPRSIAPGITASEQKDIMAMTDAERIDYFVQRLEGPGA